jgi:hypothetical protein
MQTKEKSQRAKIAIGNPQSSTHDRRQHPTQQHFQLAHRKSLLL